MKTTLKLALALTASTALPACSWVDSTGRTDNTAPQIGFDQEAISLAERSSLKVSINDDTAYNANFRELASGPTVASACSQWFAPEDSADTLQNACLSEDNCSVQFSPDPQDTDAYLLTAPPVRQPVALQYRISAEDTDGEIDNHVFSLCIQSLNDAPSTEVDTYIVEYLKDLSIPGVEFDDDCKVASGQGVLDNDQDDHDYQSTAAQTGNCISAQLEKPPTGHSGTFALSSNGGFTYYSDGTMGPGQEDHFTYTASDGDNESLETRVTIKIAGENSAPIASSDANFETLQGTRIEISAERLASDPEGFELSVVSYAQPNFGVVGLEDGELFYEPAVQFFGADSFPATVSDPAGATVDVQVSIEVLAENAAPQISAIADVEQNYSGSPSSVDAFDVAFRVTDLETDNQILQVNATSSAISIVAAQRVSTLDSTGRGSISIQPLQNGDATITVSVTDEGALGFPAKTTSENFKVSVRGMREQGVDNTRPRARNDRFEMNILQTRTFDVSTNDTDPDGDTLTFRITDRGDLRDRVEMTEDGLLTVT
ncbi:MAG: Ig-like domain-containing protein, partial [Granulosicoccaceae bacterium]